MIFTFKVVLDKFYKILGAILFLFKLLLAVFNFLHQFLCLVFGVVGLLFGPTDLEITKNMFPQTSIKWLFKIKSNTAHRSRCQHLGGRVTQLLMKVLECVRRLFCDFCGVLAQR